MTYFLPLKEVHAGDTLIADGGFTCMRESSVKEVYQDDLGLYVECDDGRHYLDAQCSFTDPEILIGFIHF